MKILYIYPHPDDESFGPAQVMHKQRREGHEVHLLTLTKGGATRQRFKYNLSIEEMGEARYKEMINVKAVLNLSGMTVLDLPDSCLKDMDPREIENAVKAEIEKIKPNVIVTYPVYGISGFYDHLVTHAVVKRVFCEMKDRTGFLKRLAFIAVTKEEAAKAKIFSLKYSAPEDIDCVVHVNDSDIRKAHEALDCYVTFKDTIDASGIKSFYSNELSFEIFGENHEPVLSDLFEKLKNAQ